MQFDEIPPLPDFNKETIYEKDEEEAINEFRNSKSKFMFYENADGTTNFFFENLDAALYACLVAKLSSNTYLKVFEFLKLVLEGVRLVKQCTKKGFEMAVKVEKHIDKLEKNNRCG